MTTSMLNRFDPPVAADSPENQRRPVDALITLLVWDADEATSRLLDCIHRGVAARATWRLLILDQGSSEPTASRLHEFAASNPAAVMLDRVDKNIGYPAGHNRLLCYGLRHFMNRYLVTINSDVAFDDRNWLDQLVDFMDARSEVGIASPTGVIYDRSSQRLGWCRVATHDEAAQGRFDSVSGSICILRQQMIDSIGLFDETFTPGYYEDTDLSFRAAACGWKSALCPLAHRHQDLGVDKSTSRIKRDVLAAEFGNFQRRNRDQFVARWLADDRAPFEPSRIRTLFPRVFFPRMEAVA